MRKVKKYGIIFAIILIYSTFFSFSTAFAAFTPDFELKSEGVYMVNLEKDVVVVAKNENQALYPASTTKIMTCLVALENISNLNAPVVAPYDCFNEFNNKDLNFYYVSNAELEGNQTTLTYKDVIYSMMVCSACDSANVLAYNIVGGGKTWKEEFAAMMNETAAKLGCTNTHFANPHGLFEPDNYTTAHDMYLIARYAVDHYPEFVKICNTFEYDMPANSKHPDGYTIYTTNALMVPSDSGPYYCEGCYGIKTGSIDWYYFQNDDGSWDWNNCKEGSRAMVSIAERDGYTYLTVSMGAPFHNEEGVSTPYNFIDHKKLYEWAFDTFHYVRIISENEQVMNVPVTKGRDTDEVGVIATMNYETLLPKSLDKSAVQQITPKLEPLEAPVEQGLEVGKLELRFGGETLTTIPLVTEQRVALDIVENYKDKAKNVFTSRQFVTIVAVMVILIVVYATALIIRGAQKRKQAEQNRRKKRMQIAQSAGKRSYTSSARSGSKKK